jgi:putative ABC transport system ATP-binding protein
MQPALILADEPTGNLDRHTGEEVVNLLEALNASGVTLIVVTHDQAMGARARRQLVMEDAEDSRRHERPSVRLGAATVAPRGAGMTEPCAST